MSTDPPLDGEGLLRALTEGRVTFIVIGGFALGAHGFRRATKDIDIVPEPSPTNFAALVDVLNDLDYAVLGLDEFEPNEIVLPSREALEAGGSWVLKTKFGRLDILQSPDPDLDFDKLASQAVEDLVFGMPVRFCSYEHLVAMKEHAGRPQDVVDLTRLRAIRGESA